MNVLIFYSGGWVYTILQDSKTLGLDTGYRHICFIAYNAYNRIYGFWQNIFFFGLSYESVNPLMFLFSFAFKYLLIFLIQELLGIMFSQKEKVVLFLYYTVLYLLYLFIPNSFYNRHLTILLPICAFLMETYAFFKIYINRLQLKKYGLFVYWGAVLAITGLIID